MQIFDQPIMIQSQGAGEIRNTGENDQTHAVAGTFADEIFEDGGGDIIARNVLAAAGPCPCAIIDQERSRASMISTPLA